MAKGKFKTGDRITVVVPGSIYTGRHGFIYGAYHFTDHSEYHVKLDGETSLFTGEFQERELAPERTARGSESRGETYMMPDGTMVNPDKLFVKGRRSES